MLSTLWVIDWNENGPDVVGGVPRGEADDDGDRRAWRRAGRSAAPPRSAAGRRGTSAADRDAARTRSVRDDRHEQRRRLERRARCDQRGGGGRDHAIASGTTTRAPAKSPSHQVRQTSGTSSLAITPPSRSESGPTVALTAVPAASATSRPPECRRRCRAASPGAARRRMSTRRHEHLEHVPAGLSERRAERERRVVVGEQVADQHSGPEPQAAERRGRRCRRRPAARGSRPRGRRSRARSRPAPRRSTWPPTRATPST